MKARRWILFAYFVLVLACGGNTGMAPVPPILPKPVDTGDRTLKIATLNALKEGDYQLVATKGKFPTAAQLPAHLVMPLQKRRANFTKAFGQNSLLQSADVIALQEWVNDPISTLDPKDAALKAVGFTHFIEGPVNAGLRIVVKARAGLQVLDSGGQFFEAATRRGFMWVKLQLDNGNSAWVINTHFQGDAEDQFLSAEREAQLHEIVDFVKAKKIEDTCIIVGDFNTDGLSAPAYQGLKGYWGEDDVYKFTDAQPESQQATSIASAGPQYLNGLPNPAAPVPRFQRMDYVWQRLTPQFSLTGLVQLPLGTNTLLGLGASLISYQTNDAQKSAFSDHAFLVASYSVKKK